MALLRLVGRLCSARDQGKAFAALGASGALGVIIGPLVGGYFSNPAKTFPALKGTVFEAYPYALPCIIGSLSAAIATIISLVYMRETLHAPKPLRIFGFTLMGSRNKVAPAEETGVRERAPSKASNPRADVALEEVQKTARDEKPQGAPRETQSVVEVGRRFSRVSCEEERKALPRAPSRPLREIMSEGPVLQTILNYVYLALYTAMYEEAAVLLVRSEVQNGGLKFGSDDLGITLSVSGVVLFFHQLILFPKFEERFGSKLNYQIGVAATIPLYIVYPFFNRMAIAGVSEAGILAVMSIYSSIRVCFSYQAFMAILVMVSNSVYKNEKGSVNGFAQSLSGTARFVGPTIMGYLTSWSQTNSTQGFFDYHFPFYVLALVVFLTLFTSKKLSTEQNKPQE